MDEAEQICAGEGVPEIEVLPLLLELVNKSLLYVVRRPNNSSETLFAMLEVIREDANSKLVQIHAFPQAQEIEARHATYYLAQATLIMV